MDNTVSPIPSYLTTLLRVAGSVVGGWLLGKGYFTSEQLAQLGGGAMVAAVAVWGLISSHSKTKKLNAAIDAPAGFAK